MQQVPTTTGRQMTGSLSAADKGLASGRYTTLRLWSLEEWLWPLVVWGYSNV